MTDRRRRSQAATVLCPGVRLLHHFAGNCWNFQKLTRFCWIKASIWANLLLWNLLEHLHSQIGHTFWDYGSLGNHLFRGTDSPAAPEHLFTKRNPPSELTQESGQSPHAPLPPQWGTWEGEPLLVARTTFDLQLDRYNIRSGKEDGRPQSAVLFRCQLRDTPFLTGNSTIYKNFFFYLAHKYHF